LGVLATDLLVGIGIGIAVKLAIHIFNGVPLRSLFKPYLAVEQTDESTYRVVAKQSAVFTNWIMFKRELERLGLSEKKNIVLDLSEARLVDHSVMEKLHELEMDFSQCGLQLTVVGLDAHRKLSAHPYSARKLGLFRIRRVTIVAEPCLEQTLAEELARLGATGFTVLPCYGSGRRQMATHPTLTQERIRIEVLLPPDVANRLLAFLRRQVLPFHHATACVETVEAMREDDFTAIDASLNGKAVATAGHL
jgi:MFS superfamily sulfate permease-like transporter